MPNYDIIPLATDLLDYTIQRVKVKEPQYTKVKAYVMENGQMVEKELFEKIKDDGKPHLCSPNTNNTNNAVYLNTNGNVNNNNCTNTNGSRPALMVRPD